MLIAHSDPDGAVAVTRLLTLGGYATTCIALTALSAAAIAQQQPDALLLLRPGALALMLCQGLRAAPEAVDLPILLVDDELVSEGAAWRAMGADDCVSSMVSSYELEHRLALLLRARECQQAAIEAGVAALLQMLATHDPATAEHARRVAALALQLGAQLGLDARSLQGMRRAALLHDIGKVAVSRATLHKPGPLNQPEQARVRQHPLIGEQIVRLLPCSTALAWVVRYHHERWDGLGYPDGLRGEDTPLCARIIAVADAFDALTTPRSYHAVLSVAEALTTLQHGAGVQWDPAVVAGLCELLATAAPLREHTVGYQQAA